jgi:hypothetical protein
MLRGLAIRLTERVHYGVSVLINLLAPQEMATYVAAPMAEAAAPVQEPVSKREAAPAESKTEVEDDSFDDASVEDIKDEEEII